MIRIEICGGIATGKTTLAKLLASTNYLVCEAYRQVPFWEQFYASPAEYEFEKNVSFLLAHADAIRQAGKQERHVICDFAQFQDLAYAALSRDPADLPVLEQIYDRVVQRQSRPTAIIHLVCSVESQLRRIRDRGRVPERSISREYLEELSRSIVSRLARFVGQTGVSIVEIDTDRVDLVGNPSQATLIAARVGLTS